MKTKKLLFIAIMLSSALFTSCKKGDTGEPGPAGTNGTNGIDGTNGNANVISTNTLSFNSSDWTLSGSLYSTTIIATGITQDIVDNGAVTVFNQSGTSTSWTALPYTFVNTAYRYEFGVGFVNLYVTNTDGTTPTNPGSETYRVVIIEGN